MRLLVLGGTRFVGRAVIQEALVLGWDVTAVHRGVTGAVPDAVAGLRADRTVPGELAGALGEQSWDVAVDTWDGSPRVATEAARLLAGRVESYGYVSSGSVYVWGSHIDETSAVVDGDPQAEDGAYPALKRGAELGVLAAFPDALLARAGLILGPHEDIGRLPWWLQRIARGGAVLAPGRPTRPLQYVDVRDLAGWLLTGLQGGLAGPIDVISRSGHATTEQLLQACLAATGAQAELVWVGEAKLAKAGIEPWTHLPCWVPEHGEFAGFLEVDTPGQPPPVCAAARSPTRSPTPGPGCSETVYRSNEMTATSTACPPSSSNNCCPADDWPIVTVLDEIHWRSTGAGPVVVVPQLTIDWTQIDLAVLEARFTDVVVSPREFGASNAPAATPEPSSSPTWRGYSSTSAYDEDTPSIRAMNGRTWITSAQDRDQSFAENIDVFRRDRDELLALLTPPAATAWSRPAVAIGADRTLQPTVLRYAEWLGAHERPHANQIARAIADG